MECQQMDILFRTDEHVFSYRVAGICIQNGKILLQRPTNDTAFALPGGHVSFGETNEQTLVREFKEEIGVNVSVGELKWVQENFFPWGNKPCHQICLYYIIDIEYDNIPKEDMFIGIEERKFKLEFHWIPLSELNNMEVYPKNVVDLINKIDQGVQHFISKE